MRYTGKDGEINVGSGVGQITSFTFEDSCDVQSSGEMGSQWKHAEPGQIEWSGSLEVVYDPDDAGQSTFVTGAKISNAIFYPLGNTTGMPSITGNIVVGSASLPVTAGELMKRTISFTGNGAYTEDTVA